VSARSATTASAHATQLLVAGVHPKAVSERLGHSSTAFAMLIIGMSNLTWVLMLSGVVFVYKLAPAASTRRTLLLSGALGALGVVYALMT
jgi:hypothetical protein